CGRDSAVRIAAPSLALVRLGHPCVILPPPCHNRPSRGPRPRAPLWLEPRPSSTACPGRVVLCCGPLQREAPAVVTGEHEGRAPGGAARKCRLFYLSVRWRAQRALYGEALPPCRPPLACRVFRRCQRSFCAVPCTCARTHH